MSLENITSSIGEFFSSLSFSQASATLQPLIIFIIGMVVYSIFVFKFYKFIASKDIFRLSKGGSHTTLKKIAYALEYVFLFPLIAFFWFLVVSSLLSMLSEVIAINNIFMVAMVTIATIRITAYYDENLSRDVAKLIPFALLAIFLIDISDISPQAPLAVLSQIPSVADILVYYFVFIVVLEFFLKLIFHGRPKINVVEKKY